MLQRWRLRVPRMRESGQREGSRLTWYLGTWHRARAAVSDG
jgi:hypothetical protein